MVWAIGIIQVCPLPLLTTSGSSRFSRKAIKLEIYYMEMPRTEVRMFCMQNMGSITLLMDFNNNNQTEIMESVMILRERNIDFF